MRLRASQLNNADTFQQMTLVEAHTLALKVLKQVMEEKVDENNVQLAQVGLWTPICTSRRSLAPGHTGGRLCNPRRRRAETGD